MPVKTVKLSRGLGDPQLLPSSAPQFHSKLQAAGCKLYVSLWQVNCCFSRRRVSHCPPTKADDRPSQTRPGQPRPGRSGPGPGQRQSVARQSRSQTELVSCALISEELRNLHNLLQRIVELCRHPRLPLQSRGDCCQLPLTSCQLPRLTAKTPFRSRL